MRYLTLLVVTMVLVACDAKVGQVGEVPKVGAKQADAPQVAGKGGKAPRMVEMPDLQPDNILGEKMNWSRQDLKVILNVSIDQSGAVLATKVHSVAPPNNRLAVEVGQLLSERFKDARFEAPRELSYPYSFEIPVNLPAARDASGRLK